MLDIGWSEILLIAVATIFLIGPKELPGVMRQIARFIRQLGAIKSSILQQVHNFIEEDDAHGKVTFLPQSSPTEMQVPIVKTEGLDNVIPLPQPKTIDDFPESKQAAQN